jgi:ABC-2 type transport system ATP-binding protein
VIAVEGLTKSYGSHRGVTDLRFEVAPGEVFGYLGPNGAGKTTTIRTMLDLIRPTSGRVSVFGLDARRDAVAIHERIGYVPGEVALYERMTGREYLGFFAEARGGVPSGRIDALAERFACDLAPAIRHLSHGNKQKLVLIQAFLHEPDLVILDEPTQGLDPLVQRTFHEVVEETQARGGTVFLSSHVMPEVERLCDRVAIIREGRLVAVEEIGDMKAKAVRTIEIHFAAPVDPSAFASLPGVQRAEGHRDVVHLTVAGPLDAVVKAAAAHEVVDLVSHEPSLEDLFLTYYGDPT